MAKLLRHIDLPEKLPDDRGGRIGETKELVVIAVLVPATAGCASPVSASAEKTRRA